MNIHPDIEAALEVARSGALRHGDPGRTDTLKISVPAEAFVVPADCVSSLGEGNTEAGFRVLERMFPSLQGVRQPHPQGKVPIVAAGGEYVIDPEHVKKIGGGSLKKGHEALKEFVEIVRRRTIRTLKKLKKPVMK